MEFDIFKINTVYIVEIVKFGIVDLIEISPNLKSKGLERICDWVNFTNFGDNEELASYSLICFLSSGRWRIFGGSRGFQG